VEGFFDRNTMFIVEVQWFGTTIAVETAVCTLSFVRIVDPLSMGVGCAWLGLTEILKGDSHSTRTDHDRSRKSLLNVRIL